MQGPRLAPAPRGRQSPAYAPGPWAFLSVWCSARWFRASGAAAAVVQGFRAQACSQYCILAALLLGGRGADVAVAHSAAPREDRVQGIGYSNLAAFYLSGCGAQRCAGRGALAGAAPEAEGPGVREALRPDALGSRCGVGARERGAPSPPAPRPFRGLGDGAGFQPGPVTSESPKP